MKIDDPSAVGVQSAVAREVEHKQVVRAGRGGNRGQMKLELFRPGRGVPLEVHHKPVGQQQIPHGLGVGDRPRKVVARAGIVSHPEHDGILVVAHVQAAGRGPGRGGQRHGGQQPRVAFHGSPPFGPFGRYIFQERASPAAVDKLRSLRK